MRLRGLPDIRASYEGIKAISRYSGFIQWQIENGYSKPHIPINGWVDPALFAALGATFYYWKQQSYEICLEPTPRILTQFQQSGFWQWWGGKGVRNSSPFIAHFSHFDKPDNEIFAKYLEDKVYIDWGMNKRMLRGFYKRFRNGLEEVFDNAVAHSLSQYGVFTCGWMNSKKTKIIFCISDLGIGFHKSIKRKHRKIISPVDAIRWAMEEGSTSRTGAIPGGIGLKELRRFITENQGSLIVASDSGFWETKDELKEPIMKELPYPIPGAIVVMEIDLRKQKEFSNLIGQSQKIF